MKRCVFGGHFCAVCFLIPKMLYCALVMFVAIQVATVLQK